MKHIKTKKNILLYGSLLVLLLSSVFCLGKGRHGDGDDQEDLTLHSSSISINSASSELDRRGVSPRDEEPDIVEAPATPPPFSPPINHEGSQADEETTPLLIRETFNITDLERVDTLIRELDPQKVSAGVIYTPSAPGNNFAQDMNQRWLKKNLKKGNSCSSSLYFAHAAGSY